MAQADDKSWQQRLRKCVSVLRDTEVHCAITVQPKVQLLRVLLQDVMDSLNPRRQAQHWWAQAGYSCSE